MRPLATHWDTVRGELWSERCRLLQLPPEPAHDGNRAAWNSLCYQFMHMRCGIYVLVCPRRGLLLFWPFCNAAYRNNWPPLRMAQGGRRDVAQACAEAQRRMPRGVSIRPDVGTWSCNGPLIDNWAREGWGDGMHAAAAALLHAAALRLAPRGPCREALYNRRDYPQLHCALREASALPWPAGCEPMAVGAWCDAAAPRLVNGAELYDFIPTLSQYTTADHADVAVPPLRSWASDSDEPPAPPARRRGAAVFRGSATTPRDDAGNHRLIAQRLLRGNPRADVRLTAGSSRCRMLPGGRVALSAYAGSADDDSLTLDQQAARFAWALYLEGNSGADRLAGLLARSFVVFVVRSSAPCVVWLRDGTLQPSVHYVDVASPRGLPSALRWAAANRGRCDAIARSGRAAWFAHMRRSSIEGAVAAALASAPPPPILRPHGEETNCMPL